MPEKNPRPDPEWSGPRPFVGRAAQLERLDHALEGTLVGRGRLAFILGERGSGKHRLVARVLEAAASMDRAVGIVELPTGEAGGVWAALRRRVTRRRRVRQFLTAVLPDWIDLIPVIGPVTTAIIRSVQTLTRPPGAERPGSRKAARRRTGAVAALDDSLEEIRSPMVVVLRNFERARDDELAGAFHALRTLPARPVLLVATVSLRQGRPPEAVLDLIREAERYDSADVLRMDPLWPAEWREAVEAATGTPIPDGWVQWFARNEPLFPGDLWRLLARAEHEEGGLRRLGDAWRWEAAPREMETVAAAAIEDPVRPSNHAEESGRSGEPPSAGGASGALASSGASASVDASGPVPAPAPAGREPDVLDGLDPDDRRFLALATEVGGTFDTLHLQSRTGLEELELQDRLARLERAGWVRFIETRAADDGFVDLYGVALPGVVEALRSWGSGEGPDPG